MMIGKRSGIIAIVLFGLLGLIVLELFARWGLGLGTPVLYIAHPTIDYVVTPNQDVSRFGNRQIYNAQSMRSPSLDTLNGRQLVLVFGDSVLNGGALTDQKDLATTRATDQHYFFGNVSAGSWGPGNHRAWMDVHGLLGATTVLFVFNSYDLDHQPAFRPLNTNTHPTRPPLMASGELITRYVSRYLPYGLGRYLALETPPDPRPRPDRSTTGRGHLQAMFSRLTQESTAVCILLHPTQTEIAHGPDPGRVGFQSLAEAWSIPVIDLAPRYLRTGDTSRLYRYRDDIHLGVAGQRVLTQALRDCNDRARPPTEP